MKCPVCGLQNPPDAAQCDCSYTFATKTGGQLQEAFYLRHRTGIIVAVVLSAIALWLGYDTYLFLSHPMRLW